MILQEDITDEALENLQVGRRQLSTEWPDTFKDRPPNGNHRILLPFWQTFQNSFSNTCVGNYHLMHVKDDRLLIWCDGTEEDEAPPKIVEDWVATVGKFVAIQDLLAVSFALDFTCVGGTPEADRSEIASLRLKAKPYGGAATLQHHAAAQKLTVKLIEFLNAVTCYDEVDCIVAMPPSDPAKTYSLPKTLAAHIAKAKGLEDLSGCVRTLAARPSLKSLPFQQKLSALLGTVKVDKNVFEGRTVLLIDDLYQSGTTMNYCAKLLLDSGASAVFGLACEKTLRSDGNVSGES